MAADIDELVDELEAELGDSANALLSAAEYQVHLQRAIAELSQVAPRERKTTLTTTEGSRELDVSSLTDRVRIDAVEYPVDEEPARFVQWSLWAETLELLVDETPGDSEDVDVFWSSLHEVDGDSSTLPAVYDTVVVTGGAGYAAAQLQAEVTNKANVAGVQAVRDWAAFSERRLEAFRRELRRLQRVRVSRLYTAAEPEPNQSTVVWDP